jgi:hypothetical protein
VKAIITALPPPQEKSHKKDSLKEADQEKNNTSKEPIKNPLNVQIYLFQIERPKSESLNSHPVFYHSRRFYRIK